MSAQTSTTPKDYVKRRVHSIMGLLIVLFLIEHLLTNSQAAFLLSPNGEGFIRAVNLIKNLPYLPVVEILLIGVPILIHGVLGIKYALTAKMNSFPSKGNKPSLPFSRNHAYSWQRITSWILLVGILLHVGYMRFYRYPDHIQINASTYYLTRITTDGSLDSIAKKLDVRLLDAQEIAKEKKEDLSPEWTLAITKKSLSPSQVIAVCPDFGTATLLMVRDAFKSPIKAILYTIFVLSACFHGFNGLWTFGITWGWVIKVRSQKTYLNLCMAIMGIMVFLGLASIWGAYLLSFQH